MSVSARQTAWVLCLPALMTGLLLGCEPTDTSPQPGDRVLSGRVTDAATGLPIPNAHVTVSGEANSADTGTDGMYELTGLHEVELVLTVSASGYTDATITVEPTATTANVALMVVGSGRIAGRVTDTSGQAVADAQVSIYGTSIAVVTDPGGLYRLNGVPPGALTIRASAAGFRSRDRTATLAQSGDLAVNFSLDRSPGSQAVTGEVFDAFSREPIPGAQLRLGNLSGVTNADGVFLITDVVGPTVTLSVSATGYHQSSILVEIVGTQAQVSIALIPDDYDGPPDPPT